MSIQIKITIDKLGNPVMTASGSTCEIRSEAMSKIAQGMSDNIEIKSNPNEIDICEDHTMTITE